MADIFCDEFASAEIPPDDCFSKTMEESAEVQDKNEDKVKEQENSSCEKNTENGDSSQTDNSDLKLIFETLASSSCINDRQLCAQIIMEQLHLAETKEDYIAAISRMCRLGDDEELSVRSESLNSLPHVALFCKEHSEDLGPIIRQQIVPYTVKLLTDEQITVRKFGHSTLKVLLENNLLDNSQLNDWICPLLSELALSTSSSEIFRSEDLSVMGEVILHIDPEITKKFFLPPFVSLCCDSSYTIRKICATNLKNFCKAYETDVTESSLLPAFLNLCNDHMWEVRKECANVFVDVARCVSSETRREILPHYFINLVNDNSVYVSDIAYSSLGLFISTFERSLVNNFSEEECNEPQIPNNLIENLSEKESQDECNRTENKTDLNENQLEKDSELEKCETKLNEIHHEEISNKEFIPNNKSSVNKHSFLLPTLEGREEKKENHNINIRVDKLIYDYDDLYHFQEGDTIYFVPPYKVRNVQIDETNKINRIDNLEHLSNKNFKHSADNSEHNLFNNFQFWRNPLPEIDKDLDSEQSETSSVDETPEDNKDEFVTDQNIVPPELLNCFVSGAGQFFNPYAFTRSFPAVAKTLGRKYWACIRDMYKKLSMDGDTNVRAIVASFTHELAGILGHKITVEDLLPVYYRMTSDDILVQTKVLTYLSRFLVHLKPLWRRKFLPFINYLLENEVSDVNWRYRFTIAEQLLTCVPLFSLPEVDNYFLPILLSLLNDKVSDVRKSAIKLFAVIIECFFQQTEDPVYKEKAISILDTAIIKYKDSDRWLQRQKYVFICEELANKRSLSDEIYIEKIVPNLFSLAWDTVANVRLAVARCINSTIWSLGYFPSIEQAHGQLLLQVTYSLKSDVDKDVRYFGQMCSGVSKHSNTKLTSEVLSTSLKEFYISKFKLR